MFNKTRTTTIISILSAIILISCGDSASEVVVTAPPSVIQATEPLTTPTSQTPEVVVVIETKTLSGPTSPTDNLDEQVEAWEVYTEGAPVYVMQNVDTPSLDGNSLQCSITGGTVFSNVHCYRNLLPEPNINAFSLALSFWFTPETTCNNQDAVSIVQAIEFTMSRWAREQRYEFAIQWENVGEGAPQWRYWDPKKPKGEQWVAFDPKITQCLQGNRWHTFTLQGKIRNEQVYYESFSINEQRHELDLTLSPITTPGEVDRLAVAVQLDGNAEQMPYDLFVDRVSFVRAFATPLIATFTPIPISTPADCSSAKIDQPPVDSNGRVDKTVKITWSPSTCRMNVQFYQGGTLLRENKSGDYSATVDLSDIPSGLTEVKIWVPGSSSPADAIWIEVQ